jgi:hypothetical protein
MPCYIQLQIGCGSLITKIIMLHRSPYVVWVYKQRVFRMKWTTLLGFCNQIEGDPCWGTRVQPSQDLDITFVSVSFCAFVLTLNSIQQLSDPSLFQALVVCNLITCSMTSCFELLSFLQWRHLSFKEEFTRSEYLECLSTSWELDDNWFGG